MLCRICQKVSRLLESEPYHIGEKMMWMDGEELHESAKQCELCEVFSKLLPAEELYKRFLGTSGVPIRGREIRVLAEQKLSDDGSVYNVEIKFARHTHTPSPSTLARVIIRNNAGKLSYL